MMARSGLIRLLSCWIALSASFNVLAQDPPPTAPEPVPESIESVDSLESLPAPPELAPAPELPPVASPEPEAPAETIAPDSAPVETVAEPTVEPSPPKLEPRIEPTQHSPTETEHASLREPRFHRAKPNWGAELAFSLNAFASRSEDQAGKFRAVSLGFEYEPSQIQKIGVLSIGPNVSLYPSTPKGLLSESPISVWSVGARIRYQARYFHEQPIVPFVGFDTQQLMYHLSAGDQGRMVLTGPFFGGQIYLNFLDQRAASLFYAEKGVIRSYLVAEVRSLRGQNEDFEISGTSYFFGLRVEY